MPGQQWGNGQVPARLALKGEEGGLTLGLIESGPVDSAVRFMHLSYVF